MVEDGSIVTNAVFARNATAMFNSSATQDAQWETLAKYVPAVSAATGKIPTLIGSENRNDINAVRYRSSWGRPAVENEQPWLHSDMKDMAYFFINALMKR